MHHFFQSIEAQLVDFRLVLYKGRPTQPLVIYLDSLDQLDNAHESHKMTWLPSTLPPGTKVIVSTLPEEQYECFPALQVYTAY